MLVRHLYIYANILYINLLFLVTIVTFPVKNVCHSAITSSFQLIQSHDGATPFY